MIFQLLELHILVQLNEQRDLEKTLAEYDKFEQYKARTAISNDS
jgi:hypothetical protein